MIQTLTVPDTEGKLADVVLGYDTPQGKLKFILKYQCKLMRSLCALACFKCACEQPSVLGPKGNLPIIYL